MKKPSAVELVPVANRIVLPNNYFYIGRVIRITASGRVLHEAAADRITDAMHERKRKERK